MSIHRPVMMDLKVQKSFRGLGHYTISQTKIRIQIEIMSYQGTLHEYDEKYHCGP